MMLGGASLRKRIARVGTEVQQALQGAPPAGLSSPTWPSWRASASGTASKALSGNGRMRPETRQRVLDAAPVLDFRPNQHAQSLHTGRSWTVGLITTDGIGRFSTPVLLGAEDALGAGKISVLLCDTRGDAIREQHHLRNLMDRRVDGIIVTGRRTDPRPPLTGVSDGDPRRSTRSPPPRTRTTSRWSPTTGAGPRLAVEHLLGTRPHPDRARHRPGTPRGRPRPRPPHRATLLNDASLRARHRPRPLRRLERGVGPPRGGGGPAHGAGHGRVLLRQRPDRPRSRRHPARARRGRARRASPSSATTTGTPWPWPPARR